ncbi:MAG: DEAD/DEAH box helicase [Bacteroidetes bacterium]|nr:DEAD/DEAH box helicase [Bacteroidota bacterium]
MPNIQEIILTLERQEALSFKESFLFAQYCSSLIKEEHSDANNIAIHVLNNWENLHDETKPIWADIVEAIGFYPYLNLNHISKHFSNFSGKLRNGRHHSIELQGKYFHEEQLELLQILKGNKNLIVSAPTSFGKSLLIEEIVASKRCDNIVIIQPTLALLDETRRKLLKYSESYKLVVRTSQEPSVEKSNIFLFTAERVNEYPNFPKIDFLVIDEFYKLSGNRDDERSASLNNVVR